MPRLIPLALTAALLCGGGVAVATQTTAGASTSAKATTRVTGQVSHQLELTRADLAKYKQHTVKVTYAGGHPEVIKHHTFTGPLLLDVIKKAGPKFRPGIFNDALAWEIVVTGSGNYRASYAWGEIEPKMENKQILLAITQDGKPLSMPRTAVPGDKGGGRYVDEVATIRVTGP